MKTFSVIWTESNHKSLDLFKAICSHKDPLATEDVSYVSSNGNKLVNKQKEMQYNRKKKGLWCESALDSRNRGKVIRGKGMNVLTTDKWTEERRRAATTAICLVIVGFSFSSG